MSKNAAFIWHGPSGAHELWPEQDGQKEGEKEAAKAPLLSFTATKGDSVELPPDHGQVKGWLAFGYLVPAPETDPAPVQPVAAIAAPKKKDVTNG